MKTIADIFTPQTIQAALPPEVAAGEVMTLAVDPDSRELLMRVRFGDFVSQEKIFAAERALMASALRLRQAIIQPAFPPESFRGLLPVDCCLLKRTRCQPERYAERRRSLDSGRRFAGVAAAWRI